MSRATVDQQPGNDPPALPATMSGLYHDVYTDTYGDPMARTGVWPYVWQDPPAAGALDGYQGALVRAANGNGILNPQGFSFADNYRAWVAKFGAARVQPWTYLYPTSNGTTAANTLHSVAGDRAVYQCDLEDAVPAATIRAFCDRLHAAVPGCKIVFDSYPTRHQFINVNGAAGAATWDQAAASFDVFCPQVYYASQRDDGWEREFGEKPIWPAFSPANWAAWDYFQTNLDRYGVVNLWRYPFTNDWRAKLHYVQEDDMSAADVDAINKHSDELYRLLARPSDGRANLTDLKAGLAAVTGEIDATQTAIANLQLAAVDPVTLAAALDPLLGADLADKVAAELAARLAQ